MNMKYMVEVAKMDGSHRLGLEWVILGLKCDMFVLSITIKRTNNHINKHIIKAIDFYTRIS